jgi:DNA-directed RNA polymerase subunit beta'
LNQLGEIIELPIKKTYAEGLTPIEYFITAHGGRKGKADTALRTAESGYLTRKLCDSSQEVIIRQEDCGTDQSLIISRDQYSSSGWGEQLYGRVVSQDIVDVHGTVLVAANESIDKQSLEAINNATIETVHIRSPLTCHSASGVCQKCYGFDLSTRSMVQIGTPVGIIAAQSIGEPATQLTLNTFHSG